MKTFRDNEGREWLVRITVDSVRRVKDRLNIDLLDVVGGQLFQRLASDPVLLCDVLFVVCLPEATERGVTDEQFGRSFSGETIEAATSALLEGLIDFFPQPKKGLLEKALKKLRELESLVAETAEKRLDDPRIEGLLREKLGDSSGDWLESLESTLDRSRSAS